jgi:hypothetical protein
MPGTIIKNIDRTNRVPLENIGAANRHSTGNGISRPAVPVLTQMPLKSDVDSAHEKLTGQSGLTVSQLMVTDAKPFQLKPSGQLKQFNVGYRSAAIKPALTAKNTDRGLSASKDTIQGIFIYSYIGDKIMETDHPPKYYERLDFKKITANGLTAFTDKRNIERAEFLLKVMSYREVPEEMPTASILSRPDMGSTDALGIHHAVQQITSRYRPGEFHFLFPGASGDIIASYMEQNLRIPVCRIALSDIKYKSLHEIDNDKEQYSRIKGYMLKSIGPIFSNNLPVVIIDAVDKGASMLGLKTLINKIDSDTKTEREVCMFSLNVTKEDLTKQGITEMSDDTDQIKFVKNRVYWQQYKEKVPRIFGKVPINDVLSGKITDPPPPNIEALLTQYKDVAAMAQALFLGQYQVTQKENIIRALMLQFGVPRKEAIRMEAGEEQEGEDVLSSVGDDLDDFI